MLFQLYDPTCEWDMSNVAEWPEKRVYRGHDGLAEYFDAWLDPWEEFENGITEAIDLPGDRIFILGYVRGRGRLSGAPVESPPFAQIIEFREEGFSVSTTTPGSRRHWRPHVSGSDRVAGTPPDSEVLM